MTERPEFIDPHSSGRISLTNIMYGNSLFDLENKDQASFLKQLTEKQTTMLADPNALKFLSDSIRAYPEFALKVPVVYFRKIQVFLALITTLRAKQFNYIDDVKSIVPDEILRSKDISSAVVEMFRHTADSNLLQLLPIYTIADNLKLILAKLKETNDITILTNLPEKFIVSSLFLTIAKHYIKTDPAQLSHLIRNISEEGQVKILAYKSDIAKMIEEQMTQAGTKDRAYLQRILSAFSEQNLKLAQFISHLHVKYSLQKE